MFHTRQRHLSRYRRHGDATDEMISIDTDALRLSYAQDDPLVCFFEMALGEELHRQD